MDEKGFDAAAHMRKIRTRQGMQDYLDVKWRILWLRAEHPDVSIVTDLVESSATHARFKATISYALRQYRESNPTDVVVETVVVTGHGSETEQDFPDFFEKAETKAIGRACAVLGYGTDAAVDFDDGTPRDGAGAAKAELRPQDHAAIEQQHERNVAPAPGGVAPRPRPQAVPPITDAPYPSVARQHGIKTMVDVLDYLVPNGFNVPSGRKADAIADLEQTFGAKITPAHGKTETDGSPIIFPGDIYDFAHFHINRQQEQEA